MAWTEPDRVASSSDDRGGTLWRAVPCLLGGLAAAALVVRGQARRAEAEHPPAGRFVEVDGVRLHYLEHAPTGAGSLSSADPAGPATAGTVVLLHGNGTMAEDFALAGLLDGRDGRRVIAFDRPGFGYSARPRDRRWTPEAQADLLARALDRLGVARATVLGHSWGTLVAVALALDHPQRVQRLVLVSGYYFPTPRVGSLMLATPALPWLGTLMRHTVSPLVGRLMWAPLMRLAFGPAPMPASFTGYPRGMSLRPSQLRAAAAESFAMMTAAARLQHRYRELRVPVTIVAGGRDRIVRTAWQSARLHRLLPDSAYVEVPGQGHMLQHLAPQAVAKALRAG